MKKYFRSAWFLVLILMLCAALTACDSFTVDTGSEGSSNLQDYPKESDGLEYAIYEDPIFGSECMITGIGTCTDTNLVIPHRIEGATVTRIGVAAFENCTQLTSVTIPNSVTTVQRYPFVGCTNLRTGYIENNSSIRCNPFAGCPSLTSLSVIGEGNLVAVDGGIINTETKTLIAGCGSSIPADGSVTVIAPYAYEGSDLFGVNIPDTVTEIGAHAFASCSSLRKMIIPNSVTRIGIGCFLGCTSLQDVTLSENLTSIGYDAFRDCTSIREITIPDSVNELGSSCFRDCTSLEKVTLPTGLKELANFVFQNCSSLEEIVLPDGLTEIGGSAFYDCTSLKSIIFSQGLEKIGQLAFHSCTSLTSLIFPTSIKDIGFGAFSDCTSLEKTVFEGGCIESMDSTVFSDCSALKEVTIPSGIHDDPLPFKQNCPSFTIYFGGTSEEWYAWVHQEDGNYSMREEIGETVVHCSDGYYVYTTIEDGDRKRFYEHFFKGEYDPSVYESADNLKNHYFHFQLYPETGTCVIYGILKPGTETEELVIPDYIFGHAVTEIGYRAFKDKTVFTSLTISNNVKTIGLDAFEGCTNIRTVNVENGDWSFNPYFGCTNVSNVTVFGDNGYLKVVDGCLINTKTKTLLAAFGDCKIPDDGSVTRIENAAFCGMPGMTELIIPEAITEIHRTAFQGCNDLTDIYFPGTYAKWEEIGPSYMGFSGYHEYVVHCTDGDIKHIIPG